MTASQALSFHIPASNMHCRLWQAKRQSSSAFTLEEEEEEFYNLLVQTIGLQFVAMRICRQHLT